MPSQPSGLKPRLRLLTECPQRGVSCPSHYQNKIKVSKRRDMPWFFADMAPDCCRRPWNVSWGLIAYLHLPHMVFQLVERGAFVGGNDLAAEFHCQGGGVAVQAGQQGDFGALVHF